MTVEDVYGEIQGDIDISMTVCYHVNRGRNEYLL